MKILNFLYAILLMSGVTTTMKGQDNPRLIVRSDDLGAFHSVNEACIKTYKEGITTVLEVMTVTPWFPEAVKMLKENPKVDVGVHLTITSEWENIKWRPLTVCPSLVDDNGYFWPMMGPNSAYPQLSVIENDFNVEEIEQEYRAQIELALKNIPQISHLSGHMGAQRLNPKVSEMVLRLAKEYNLVAVDMDEFKQEYDVEYVRFEGLNTTSEKENSFIKMLDKLQGGKDYVFLEHPAFANDEMATVGHIGYEWVAEDRQGITDLLTSSSVKKAIVDRKIELINYNQLTRALPRNKKNKSIEKAVTNLLKDAEQKKLDLHSIMVLHQGEVVAEQWMSEGRADKEHIMNSVSKSFVAAAVGFAVDEGLLKVTDKVISFFPDKLPKEISSNLQEMEIRHLLTMNAGHNVAPEAPRTAAKGEADWDAQFLAATVDHKPSTHFAYSSYASYMVSSIIQRVTGQTVLDYLYPRLLRPLGIVGAEWVKTPDGVNVGGWGMFIKTEDMAKMGQLLLQKGMWNGVQILSESWINEATSCLVKSVSSDLSDSELKEQTKNSDWAQGYGYYFWRCRNNTYRADGAKGQFILVIPEKKAVVITTANIDDTQAELDLIWKHIYPKLK